MNVNDMVIYFHSFGVEYMPKQIKKFIANKNITINIYRIQAYDSDKFASDLLILC